MTEIRTRRIPCPKCRTETDAPLMTKDGTGYLQESCSFLCANPLCRQAIAKERLCARKFAETVASTGASARCHLAGTFFSNDQTQTLLKEGDQFKQSIYASAREQHDVDEGISSPHVLDRCDPEYRVDEQMCQAIMKKLYNRVALGRFGEPQVFRRIVSAYRTDKIYSVDLVGAVLRQGSFIQKMQGLRWTDPQRFSENTTVLQQCVTRYHAFLDLMAIHPNELLVPTLDIDLAWHTHQLLADKYESDCFKHVGRFVDHDDKIEGLTLSSGFDRTSWLWKASRDATDSFTYTTPDWLSKDRFKVDYSHCGCSPQSKKVGLLSRLMGSSSHSDSELVPVAQTDQTDGLLSTHGSDHNAVYFGNTASSLQLKNAQDEYHFLRATAERRALKSRKDMKENAGKKGEVVLAQHDPAFLVPLPEIATPYPPTCVATNGVLVNHAGGCGSGNGVCGGGCVAELSAIGPAPLRREGKSLCGGDGGCGGGFDGRS